MLFHLLFHFKQHTQHLLESTVTACKFVQPIIRRQQYLPSQLKRFHISTSIAICAMQIIHGMWPDSRWSNLTLKANAIGMVYLIGTDSGRVNKILSTLASSKQYSIVQCADKAMGFQSHYFQNHNQVLPMFLMKHNIKNSRQSGSDVLFSNL